MTYLESDTIEKLIAQSNASKLYFAAWEILHNFHRVPLKWGGVSAAMEAAIETSGAKLTDDQKNVIIEAAEDQVEFLLDRVIDELGIIEMESLSDALYAQLDEEEDKKEN